MLNVQCPTAVPGPGPSLPSPPLTIHGTQGVSVRATPGGGAFSEVWMTGVGTAGGGAAGQGAGGVGGVGGVGVQGGREADRGHGPCSGPCSGDSSSNAVHASSVAYSGAGAGVRRVCTHRVVCVGLGIGWGLGRGPRGRSRARDRVLVAPLPRPYDTPSPSPIPTLAPIPLHPYTL